MINDLTAAHLHWCNRRATNSPAATTMGLELGPKTLSSPARRSRESIDKAEKILARVRRGRAAAAGSPTPAASPYRNVLRERVDTLHKRLSEGGAPTPAPDDDDAATLSPGGKLRAELSRRASERVAVAVRAEFHGAFTPSTRRLLDGVAMDSTHRWPCRTCARSWPN